MPGEYEDKFSNLRAYLGYMYAHPGKKLLFMGAEFGQFIEWNEEEELDWSLLEFEKHKKQKEFTMKLCDFYLKTPALWELDLSWEGFEWADVDDNINNVIAFFRRDKNGNLILAVSNFSSVLQKDYKIGVPFSGDYTEVFSSDNKNFGGQGIENGKVTAKKGNIHGRDKFVSLTLPPFSTLYFYKKKPAERKKPADKIKSSKDNGIVKSKKSKTK